MKVQKQLELDNNNRDSVGIENFDDEKIEELEIMRDSIQNKIDMKE
jgi:hypothetical protein